MNYGEVQKLWVKGLGYVADKHIYKYKDYSECVFDTQIESKEWLCHEMKKIETKLAIPLTHVSVLACWYGIVLIPFLYQTFGEINVDLYDVDEYTSDIAKYIWNEHPKVNVHTKDVVFDNIDYKVRVFPFLFSMYQWIEDTLGVTPVFNQIPVSLPVSMSQPLSPEGRWIFSSSRDRLAKRLNEPPPLLTTGE